MKTLVIVVSLLCITCLIGCHPKKMRPLETPEEEQVGEAGRERKIEERVPGDTEEPIRPIQPRETEEIILGDVHFEFDKYDLTLEAKSVLGDNAAVLLKHPKVHIRIEGHCDERGTEEYNLALGEKRALAARDFFVRFGIDKSRVSTISYGEEKPLARGHDEEAWAKNRRAHFVIE